MDSSNDDTYSTTPKTWVSCRQVARRLGIHEQNPRRMANHPHQRRRRHHAA